MRSRLAETVSVLVSLVDIPCSCVVPSGQCHSGAVPNLLIENKAISIT
jgi:hypothetical protein